MEPQVANLTGTLNRYLKIILSKKGTFAEKDEPWYDLVARDLREGIKDRHSAGGIIGIAILRSVACGEDYRYLWPLPP